MSLVPYVVEQTSRGERSYDIYSKTFKRQNYLLRRRSDRCICKYCYCTDVTLFLEAEDPSKDIPLH